MKDTDIQSFDHKICRSCGQIFYGENDVCDDCLNIFSKLETELRLSKYTEYLKYCKYCGRPFIGGYEAKRGTTTYFQPTRTVYCKGIDGKGSHYCQCQNCGGSAKATTSGGNWPEKVGCSRKCSNMIKRKKTVETCLAKYGAEAPSQSVEVQAKIRKTTFE